MLGTETVDLRAMSVVHFNRMEADGVQPPETITKCLGMLLKVAGDDELQLPEPVRGYFSEACDADSLRLNGYEIEAPNAHAAAYQLIARF